VTPDDLTEAARELRRIAYRLDREGREPRLVAELVDFASCLEATERKLARLEEDRDRWARLYQTAIGREDDCPETPCPIRQLRASIYAADEKERGAT
jgi:hypothetical protein